MRYERGTSYRHSFRHSFCVSAPPFYFSFYSPAPLSQLFGSRRSSNMKPRYCLLWKIYILTFRRVHVTLRPSFFVSLFPFPTSRLIIQVTSCLALNAKPRGLDLEASNGPSGISEAIAAILTTRSISQAEKVNGSWSPQEQHQRAQPIATVKVRT